MSVDCSQLIKALSTLVDEKNIRVTIKQSGEGAAICAAFSFVGGLLLGPRGLAIGGVLGSLAAYSASNGTFRSLGDVLKNDLNHNQKKRLVQLVTKAVEKFQPTNLAMLIPVILNNDSIQQAVLKTVVSFVTSELQLQIID